MQRRHIVPALGGIALTALGGTAFAQTKSPADHGGHVMSGGGKYKAVEDTAAHCVMTGQECLRHCFETFTAGDTSLALCARSVRELVAACHALQDLAASNSSYVPAMSKVVAAICTGCEAECRKHVEHAECKACADACKGCAAECRKIGA